MRRIAQARHFDEGAAVIGRGWLVRLGRLRLIWAPPPDPYVTRVVAQAPPKILRLTLSWTQEAPNFAPEQAATEKDSEDQPPTIGKVS